MRSAYPDSLTIRPRMGPAALTVVAISLLSAAIGAGALRTGQPLVAWIGVAMELGCVAIADRLLRTVRLSPNAIAVDRSLQSVVMPFADIRGYGLRRAWSYRSGRWTYLTVMGKHGARFDVPMDYFRQDDVSALMVALAERVGAPSSTISPPGPDWAAAAAAVTAVVVIGMACVLATVALPATLSAERLFSEGAAAGVVAGFLSGGALGRLAHRAPLAVAALLSVMLLPVFGSAALILNVTGPRGPLRTVSVTVVSRRTFVERGRETYVVDARIDGMPKRFFPSAAGWQRLGTGDTFEGCVRGGRLGYPVIVQLTHPCDAAAAAR